MNASIYSGIIKVTVQVLFFNLPGRGKKGARRGGREGAGEEDALLVVRFTFS